MAVVEVDPKAGEQVRALEQEYPASFVVDPGQAQPMPVAAAEGRYFWDYDGKRYLDFASQLVNLNIGHQHPKIVAGDQGPGRPALHDRAADGERQARGAGAPRRRGDAGRPLQDVLHERRRGGERERDEARPRTTRAATRSSFATARTTARRPARSRSPATRAAGRPSRGCRASCACSTRTRTAARPATPIRARCAPARRTSRRS